MLRFKVLQMDEGGEGALAFGQSQVERLIQGGIHDFTRMWSFGSFTVRARCNLVGKDHVAKMTVSGVTEDRSRLYAWPAATAARNFSLVEAPKDSSGTKIFDPNKRVVVTGPLAPLGDHLSFEIIANFGAATYVQSAKNSRHARISKMLAAHDQWLLWEQFGVLVTTAFVDRMEDDPGELVTPPARPPALSNAAIAALSPSDRASYLQAVAYWRRQLTIHPGECLFSAPLPAAPGVTDFLVLLGSMVIDTTDGDPNNAALRYFRGVVIPFSTIVELGSLAGQKSGGWILDLTEYNALLHPDDPSNATDAATAARAAELLAGVREVGRHEYELRDVLDTSVVVGIQNDTFSGFTRGSPRSLLAAWTGLVWLRQNSNPFAGFVDDARRTYTRYEVHRLTTGGVVIVTPIDFSAYADPLALFTQNLGAPANVVSSINFNPYQCGLMVYDGDGGFLQIGDASYSGSTWLFGPAPSSGPGTIAMSSAIPFSVKTTNNVVGAMTVWMPEYELAVGNEIAVLGVDGRTFVANQVDSTSFSSLTTGFVGPSDWVLDEVGPSLLQTVSMTGSGFRFFDQQRLVTAITPRSGRPVTQAITVADVVQAGRQGGIYWYRGDAPTGVLIFYVKQSETSAWRAACIGYQTLFVTKAPTDPTALALRNAQLETFLNSVEGMTHVIANNFASRLLLPWLAMNDFVDSFPRSGVIV